MIIFYWILINVLFLLLIAYFLNRRKEHEGLTILLNGFKNALSGWGLFTKSKDEYVVELYKWIILDDEDVCDECLKKASLPAMDIADWMKEGLPEDPPPYSACGGECKCKLVLFEKRSVRNRHHTLS